jgi:hypothetical protein
MWSANCAPGAAEEAVIGNRLYLSERSVTEEQFQVEVSKVEVG